MVVQLHGGERNHHSLISHCGSISPQFLMADGVNCPGLTFSDMVSSVCTDKQAALRPAHMANSMGWFLVSKAMTPATKLHKRIHCEQWLVRRRRTVYAHLSPAPLVLTTLTGHSLVGVALYMRPRPLSLHAWNTPSLPRVRKM